MGSSNQTSEQAIWLELVMISLFVAVLFSMGYASTGSSSETLSASASATAVAD